MACVKSVNHYTITLGVGTASANTGDISGDVTNLAYCVPFFTKRVTTEGPSDGAFDEEAVDVYISGNAVYAETAVATNRALAVEITLVEFDSARTNVYPVSFSFSTTGGNQAIGGTVTIANSFVFMAYKCSSASEQARYHTVKAVFSGTSNVSVTRAGADGTITGHLWVVEATQSDFVVQECSFVIADGDSSGTYTMAPSVTPGKTWLVGSFSSPSTDTGNTLMYWSNRVDLNAPAGTTITATKAGTDWITNFTVYAVTHSESDDTVVQRGSYTDSADTNPIDITLSPSITNWETQGMAKAPVDAPHSNASHSNNYVAGVGNIQVGMTFISAGATLRAQRNIVHESQTNVFTWEAVDFELTGAEPPARRIFIIS